MALDAVTWRRSNWTRPSMLMTLFSRFPICLDWMVDVFITDFRSLMRPRYTKSDTCNNQYITYQTPATTTKHTKSDTCNNKHTKSDTCNNQTHEIRDLQQPNHTKSDTCNNKTHEIRHLQQQNTRNQTPATTNTWNHTPATTKHTKSHTCNNQTTDLIHLQQPNETPTTTKHTKPCTCTSKFSSRFNALRITYYCLTRIESQLTQSMMA